MRRFYVYDPLPTLQTMNAPLLAIFGSLDTPEGVKANVRAIKQILAQAGRALPQKSAGAEPPAPKARNTIARGKRVAQRSASPLEDA
jgi:hypothetical protein